MPDDSAFAVVVVTHNHAETLPACLSAMAALSPGAAEAVVVDNGSADGSAEIAEAFAGEPPLQVLRMSANTGFAAGANAGIAATTSPWVLLLNPDCAPRADFVRRLLQAALQRPERSEIGSVTGRLVRASGPVLEEQPVIDAAGMVVTPDGRHLDRGAGEPEAGRYLRPAWVFGGTAAATLYRRAALTDVAYPDGSVLAPSFFAYREDAELAWRLQWRGWRCLYVPEAAAAHQRHLRPERGRWGHGAINRLSVRNRFLLRLHCADAGWHWRCFPWWLLRDLVVIGACLTVERSSFGALLEVCRRRSEARACRRWVLGRARVSSRQIARWFRIGGWVEEVSSL